MIQKMTETGFANSCEWLGDAYDDIHSEESRNLAAGRSMFRIAIDEVANRWKGPKTPDPEPYPVYTAGQTPFNDGAPSTMNTIDRQETLT